MKHRFNAKSAAEAGLIAGAVFLVLEMLLVGIAQGTPWAPPRMIGAILLGPDALPPPAGFALGAVLAGLVVHFVMSALFGLGIGALVSRMSTGTAILVGLAAGLVLYVVNFYVLTAVFPWFADGRNLITIVAHLVFGGVAAWAYKELAARARPMPGFRRAEHRA